MTKNFATDTRLVHGGRPSGGQPLTVNPPVYHASTILFPTLDALQGRDPSVRYTYGRHGTPTTRALEDVVRGLEGAEAVFLTPSGMAAVSAAILAFATRGGHALVTASVYEPVRNFMDGWLTRFGVTVDYYNPRIGADIAGLIRPETCFVLVESPGSLTFEVQDIPAIAAAAHRRGVPVIADATWGGGYFMKALALGADVAVQAATKHLVGHADALLGALACNPKAAGPVKDTVTALGLCAGPDDIYLALRGARSLGPRLRQHQETGLLLARWLAARPEVLQVLHPALPDHPDHALWQRDFTGACGLFAFVMRPVPRPALAAMMDGLKLFGMGFSWGGVESLLLPVSAAFRTVTAGPPCAALEDGQLMRIHAGLEAPEDLIADLEAGFTRLATAGNRG